MLRVLSTRTAMVVGAAFVSALLVIGLVYTVVVESDLTARRLGLSLIGDSGRSTIEIDRGRGLVEVTDPTRGPHKFVVAGYRLLVPASEVDAGLVSWSPYQGRA